MLADANLEGARRRAAHAGFLSGTCVESPRLKVASRWLIANGIGHSRRTRIVNGCAENLARLPFAVCSHPLPFFLPRAHLFSTGLNLTSDVLDFNNHTTSPPHVLKYLLKYMSKGLTACGLAEYQGRGRVRLHAIYSRILCRSRAPHATGAAVCVMDHPHAFAESARNAARPPTVASRARRQHGKAGIFRMRARDDVRDAHAAGPGGGVRRMHGRAVVDCVTNRLWGQET